MQDLQSYYHSLQKDDIVKNRCEEIIALFLNQRITIRLCAENLCMSKSNVHFYIHHKIKDKYPDEYQVIRNEISFLKKEVSITMGHHYHCYILLVIKIMYSALQL